jgi:quercetin dioxygenase-like cupin family protein
MKVFHLVDELEYDQDRPHAEPLFVSDTGRVLLFTFHPGQAIPEADAPSSPMFYIVLAGDAQFTNARGQEEHFGPNTMVAYDPGEKFEVTAGPEGAVIVAVMRETQMARRESARGG